MAKRIIYDQGMETLTATPARPGQLDSDFGAYARAPDELTPIVQTVLLMPEHAHLVDGEAAIDWLLKRDEKIKGGRQVLGTANIPRVQGELNPCFQWLLENYFGRMPDFLIILDREFWLSATRRQREILVYHELTHCIHKKDMFGDPLYDENERPRWGLRGHDVEEFTAVVRRYGAWNPDLAAFFEAAKTHALEARAPELPAAGD